MTTDPLNAAVGRIDAAVGADSLPQPSSITSRDLADLATAIDRVEALIAAGAEPGPERSAAVERIADIAFVLHEREVEPSLCDALDAAVREIGDSGEPDYAGRERRDQAAELLRELSRRVSDMMAATEAARRAERLLAAESPRRVRRHDDEEAGEGERGGLFDLDVEEDDEFARLVASITGELPSRTDPENPTDATAIDAAPEPEAAWQEEMALSALMAADTISESAVSPPDKTTLEYEAPLPEATAPDEPAASGDAPVLPAEGEMIADPFATVPDEVNALQGDIVGDDRTDLLSVPGATGADETEPEIAVFVESAAGVLVLEASLAAAAAAAAAAADDARAADGVTGEITAVEIGIEQSDAPASGETIEPPLLEQLDTPSHDQQMVQVGSGEFIPDPLAAAFPAPDAPPPVEVGDDQSPAAQEDANGAVATSNEPQPLALPGPDEVTPVAMEGSDDAVVAEEATDLDSPPQVFDFAAEQTGAVDEDRGAQPSVAFDQIQPGDLEAGYAEPEHAETDQQIALDIGALEPPAEIPASAAFDPPQPSLALLPAPEPSIDPKDDPGDLFAPMPESQAASMPQPAPPAEDALAPLDLSEFPDQLPVPPPSEVEPAGAEAADALAAQAEPGPEAVVLAAAAAIGAAPPLAPDVKSPLHKVAPRGGAPVPAQPASRPASNDPLSPVRALSEEEMIALFS